VDPKAEYSALSSTLSQKKKLKQTTPVPLRYSTGAKSHSLQNHQDIISDSIHHWVKYPIKLLTVLYYTSTTIVVVLLSEVGRPTRRPNVNVNVNQEFLAWLKLPKLLQSPKNGCAVTSAPLFLVDTSEPPTTGSHHQKCLAALII